MDSLKVETGMKYFIQEGLEKGTLINDFFSTAKQFAYKVVVAILVYWVLTYLVKLLIKSLNLLMLKKNVDLSVRNFFCRTINILAKIILFIVVIGILGVDTTSFIAMLGAMGLAIGLALQGTLQNFAGGVIVLLFKPFKLGDEIETTVVDHRGIVNDINIFTTTIVTFDNVSVIIPNSELATKTLINYTKEGVRRIDEVVGIDYGDSVQQAREIILEVLREDERVIKEKGIDVVVAALNSSSVDLKIIAWASRENFYGLKSHVREEVHRRFKEEGITIPFPQLQVHNSKG